MVSKAILPWFGGTPAVWTTCLLFFQTLLFAGYAYAHFTTVSLSRSWQALVHIGLLIIALVLLRVLPGANWQPKGDEDPTRQILLMLALTIGLPYFVLSSTGPLLQAWFAHSFPGRSPYRLYALSNVGSLLALVSYPFLFERLFDLSHQAAWWATGFILFAFLCAFAALVLRRVAKGDESANTPWRESHENAPAEASAPTALKYLLWLILPAFASVVLMATTNHVSTDVAVVPLLWVVPLALYLLTFIIAFDRPTWYRRIPLAVVTIFAIYATSLVYSQGIGTMKLYKCGMTGTAIQTVAEKLNLVTPSDDGKAVSPEFSIPFVPAIVVNFVAMFGICLLCHGELARLKPATRHLTAYYLMMSAGGALGGLAVSVIAPHVFSTVYEWNMSVFVAAVLSLGFMLYALVHQSFGLEPAASAGGLVAGEADAVVSQRSMVGPRVLLVLLLPLMAFLLLDLTDYLFATRKNVVYQSRNFFGTLTIRHKDASNPRQECIELLNGTTIHGSQFMAADRRGQPTSYYSPHSGIGLVLGYFRENRPPGGVRIADVGLGTGTLAAYVMKGDFLTFYEINPSVIEMSTSGKWFTYVPDCRARGAKCDIKLGDARLTLADEVKTPNLPKYHVLVLDAFSGDAVPTHLLTAEAYDIYLPRLATEAVDGADGALIVHVSNRYLDLARVVRAMAEKLDMPCVQIQNKSDAEQLINGADWMVLTHNKALLAALQPAAYKPDEPVKPPVLWTDARSSLFEIIK